MSYKTCPDWPELMEIAPELQFKHMTVARRSCRSTSLDERCPHVSLDEVEICCDVEHHVFNAATRTRRSPQRSAGTHWFEVERVGHVGPGHGLERRRRHARLHVRSPRAARSWSLPRRREETACRRRARRRWRSRCSATSSRPALASGVRSSSPTTLSATPVGAQSARRPGWWPGRSRARPGSALVDGHALVVNADLPCVTAARAAPARCRRAWRSSPRRTGRRTRSRSRDPSSFARSTAPGSAARFAAHAPSRVGRDPRTRARRRHARRPRAARRADTRLRRRRDLLARSAVKVACLSGGVGGAKLARGLQDVLAPGELTVIGNVGDDLEVLGLHVSPDLDSLLYALAGLQRRRARLGPRRARPGTRSRRPRPGAARRWFRLGDLDLGLHLVRTQALRQGEPLSAVTAQLAARGRACDAPLPATDDVAAHPRRDTGAARSRSRSGSSRAATETRSTRSTTRAPPAPRRAGRARGDRGRRRARDRAEQPVRLDRPDPRRRGDPRRRSTRAPVPCVAVSPLIGGRAVRGPPTVCSRGWRAAPRPRTSRIATTGLIDALVIDEATLPRAAPRRPRLVGARRR